MSGLLKNSALRCLLMLCACGIAGAQPANRMDAQPRAVAPRGALGEDEKANIAIFKNASPSVVNITTLENQRNLFSLDIFQVPKGTGSGFTPSGTQASSKRRSSGLRNTVPSGIGSARLWASTPGTARIASAAAIGIAAPIIAITAASDAPLADAARKANGILLLIACDEESCPHDLAPTASSTAMLVLGDALAIALLAVVYLGPMAAWSHTFVWVHMAQHLVAMMVAAPLLVLSAPLTLVFRASSPAAITFRMSWSWLSGVVAT